MLDPKYKMTVADVYEILKSADDKTLSYGDIIADFAMSDIPMDKYLLRVGISLGIMQSDCIEEYEKNYSRE